MKTSVRNALLANDLKSKLRKPRRNAKATQAVHELSNAEQRLLVLSLHFVAGMSADQIQKTYGGKLHRIDSVIRRHAKLFIEDDLALRSEARV